MLPTENWLPLAEYSMKHQVSVSTLRRRIKAEDIQYRFDDGKYMILDDEHRPSLKSEVQAPAPNKPPQKANSSNLASPPSEASESVITAANRLLTDLKKAYTQVLHEKENQIQQLKQEIADTRTLVKVLEFENEKLRQSQR